MGSSIQGKILRHNVGKLPWAAGTGYNLQGLSKRGQKPKEERAQRERRMSQYERRRRGNALPGDGTRLPKMALSARRGRERMQQALLDQLISLCNEQRRHFETERLGSLEVNHQLELRGLLDGQVGGLGALQNLIDIDRGAPIQAGKICPIGH